MDITYHYPPDLTQLLIETIPRLCPRKTDVLLFFRGAGLAAMHLVELERALKTDKSSVNKYGMVRALIQGMNERGESALRERREVLKRVVEFENFSTCWSGDVLEAKGLVAEIRALVNVKDSFTRMRQEQETERKRFVELRDAELKSAQERKMAIEAVRRDLFSLFGANDRQVRGLAIEEVLNRLFDTQGLLVRESFERRSEASGRVLEQIDGVIELDGQLYLVEFKWLSDKVDVVDVSRHLARVFTRDSCKGLFFSATDYTEAAVSICKDALGKATLALGKLDEIVRLLEEERDLREFLRRKLRAATLDKNPFHLIYG